MLKDDQRFVPAYNNYGSWIYYNGTLNFDDSREWLRTKIRQNHQTTIIPYNCKFCFNWMRNLYDEYIISRVFKPKKISTLDYVLFVFQKEHLLLGYSLEYFNNLFKLFSG